MKLTWKGIAVAKRWSDICPKCKHGERKFLDKCPVRVDTFDGKVACGYMEKK